MILSVILTIYFINQSLNWSFIEFINSNNFKKFDDIIVFESFLKRNHFIKSFIGGIFITVCMTGLDQDMMQKNLTCRSLKEAQKNMVVFSIVLVFITFLFLVLGALLFIYAEKNNIPIPELNGLVNPDLLFPEIALNSGLGTIVGITFLLGLIAAAYSSADSALTSLTTSFCVDFLNLESKELKEQKRIRKTTHVLMSFVLVVVILIFEKYLTTNVIDGLLTVAGYTYGPLLGLFAFGIFTKRSVEDKYVWIVATLSVILVIIISKIPPSYIGNYIIGYELLPINGAITFLGLKLISRKQN